MYTTKRKVKKGENKNYKNIIKKSIEYEKKGDYYLNLYYNKKKNLFYINNLIDNIKKNYLLAADLNNTRAIIKVIPFIDQDEKIYYLLKAINLNNTYAMIKLGYMYIYQNIDISEKLFKKAISLNNNSGYGGLGLIERHKNNFHKSIELYKKSNYSGYKYYMIGLNYENLYDFKNMDKYYKKAFNFKNIHAMDKLSKFYRRGINGYEKNYFKSMDYDYDFEKSYKYYPRKELNNIIKVQYKLYKKDQKKIQILQYELKYQKIFCKDILNLLFKYV